MADLYDLQHYTKAKRKPKPYPRPWPDERTKTYGDKTRMTVARLRAVLAANRETEVDDG